VTWIGYNLWPKIIVAALATFFPVLINMVTGLRAVDPCALEFLQSVGANRAEIFQRLRWHAAMPYLFSALKVSINLSLIGAIVGEWFGAEVGIGKIIRQTGLKMDMSGMFAAIALLVLTGCALMVLVGWIERRVLFWHASTISEGEGEGLQWSVSGWAPSWRARFLPSACSCPWPWACGSRRSSPWPRSSSSGSASRSGPS
jgi:NitT/TauT family transport system permease protein